ncbi:transcriptional regulator, TetR family [Faunimonas pinastri]|uniref:Transcriptional regulator, TetR family n=1 Tax=Faunimonas pinastri TaxID=1855383 RepID=A0A1H9NZW1_9HYPH|nr:TetR family transcriptional regulator C-terminal domain-containing protein [Faunimonas pinastri]SER41468.1 transcriptional regulator, TetR family [Faunimonas pinastri]
MNRPEPDPALRATTRTRIQSRNREIIVQAALEVFSTYGFRGTTLDQIAAKAGMSKPNLLYYFPRKEGIYVAVLEETLTEWLEPLTRLDEAGDPVDEIRKYIVLKLELSRRNPAASRLFANEILHGAPSIGGFLTGPLRALVDEKSAIISRWIAEGRLAPVDPRHLIITIWAVTQHYADFDVQVRAVLGSEAEPIPDAEATILSIFLNGLRPR